MESTQEREIDIKDFILDKYIPAKELSVGLKLQYGVSNNEQSSTEYTHAQQRCENLMFPFSVSKIGNMTIKEVNVLVDEDIEFNTKRVLEFKLDRKAHFSNINYKPGDTIAILPSNPDKLINVILIAIGIESKANDSCRLSAQPIQEGLKKLVKIPPYIPTVTTPKEILRDCLNIHAVPKKQFLSCLAQCCSNNEEKEFLHSLSSKEGSHHYNNLFLEKGLILTDLLQLCPSCKPSLELLIEHLPRLLPRPYSISNSPLTSEDMIKIIFSIHIKKPGVTTSMMATLANTLVDHSSTEPLPKLLAYFREPNKFRYTEQDIQKNQILISVGTGLAPFIGFLEHKQILNETNAGITWLFVGATTEDSILYRDFLMELRIDGILNKYYESLSRVSDAPYHYIQEHLEANSKEFVDFFMQPETSLYLCADGSHISKSIQAAIAGCLQKELRIDEVQVIEIIKTFRNNGKYREDLWI